MTPYKDYQPTGFDPKGLGLKTRQNWLVLLIKTRDSDLLDICNFDVALDQLGGESKNVEVHRFNHWGPGYFDLLIINPNDPKTLEKAETIENLLEEYPVLDDDKYSDLCSSEQRKAIESSIHDIVFSLEETLNIIIPVIAYDDLPFSLFLHYLEENSYFEFYEDRRFDNDYCDAKIQKADSTVLLTKLIELGVPFDFSDEFNFYSHDHPECLNASLMRALAKSTHKYTLPIDIPLWAYPNPKQEVLI